MDRGDDEKAKEGCVNSTDICESPPAQVNKNNELIQLYAEKVVLEVLCETFYGIKPESTRRGGNDKEIWTTGRKIDWLSLPQEIWLTIFSCLSQAEIYFNVHKVCRDFNKWSRDISLWREINFHKMHEDMVSHNSSNTRSRVSKATFKNLLTIFSDYVNSVKMSRFMDDCSLHELTLKYICSCKSLTKLDVGFCEDVDLPVICQNCTGLEELVLEGCGNLVDDNFRDIHLLHFLKKLCVSYCVYLTDNFLAFLYDLSNFKALLCDGVTHITESGFIKFFKRQTTMEVLVLDGEDMSDDLVCYFVSKLPNIIVFELSFSQSLTDRSLYAFKGCYRLQGLKFRKASEMTGSALCKIFQPSSVFQLRSFEITECEFVDDNALTALAHSCPHLSSITVDWCWSLTDHGICQVVINCRKLERISIVGLFYLNGDSWLDNLEIKLPHLQFLDASDCNHLEDEKLISLVCRKPSIEAYTYYHDKVTPDSKVQKISDPVLHHNKNTVWLCPGERGQEIVF